MKCSIDWCDKEYDFPKKHCHKNHIPTVFAIDNRDDGNIHVRLRTARFLRKILVPGDTLKDLLDIFMMIIVL